MTDFLSLGLSGSTVETIRKMGFEQPTPIQEQAIPQLLEHGRDMVGLAQTGTGKTAAFGLPLIELVDTKLDFVQALVLAPTRELCLQITNELKAFGSHNKHLHILAVYGGADIVAQIRAIKRGVQIVIATPGRLRDLLRRKAIYLDKINYVVLDEADEMLNMGFKEEIDEVLETTPDDKQTWLFSATMPPDVYRISKEYMNNPVEMSVRGKAIANVDIDHQYVIVHPSDRVEVLKRFLDAEPDAFALVFCRTRRESKDVAEQLARDGYSADALNGDLSQSQRDRVMSRYRARHLRVLVATDVAARGIDVQEITHVFHCNIPDDLAFYTHRSGRTGRAGSKGISLILAHPNDLHLIKKLEKKIKIKFSKAHIPTGREICEQQVVNYIRTLKNVEESTDMQNFMPIILEELKGVSREELIEKMALLAFTRHLKKYSNAPDLNKVRTTHKKKRAMADLPMKRFYINIGRMDVENKGQLLSILCKYGRIPGSAVGKIDLNRTFTHFDIEERAASKFMDSFQDVEHKGRPIRIDLSESKRKKPFKKKGKKKKFFKKKRRF